MKRRTKGHKDGSCKTVGSIGDQLQPLVNELRNLADAWGNSPIDPHNIANAVMVALKEVSNAIVRAYGYHPNDK